MTHAAAAPGRSRADAVRNAGRVLAAAREVFSERGVQAGIEEVAARAGVGKATVYRCYPTKEELVAAVVGARVEWFTELTVAALRSPDPWAAYTELLGLAASAACDSALLDAGLVSAPPGPVLDSQRAVLRGALQELLDLAVAQGRARPGVTAREVTVLLSGAFRTLREEGVTDLGEWHRYAELVALATRA